MNQVTIENYPEKHMKFSCFPQFEININKAVREKLKTEELTHDTALRILNDIQFWSKVKSYIPLGVLLGNAVLMFVTGFAVITAVLTPTVNVAIIISLVALAIFATVVFLIVMGSDDFLRAYSEAHENQSQRAQKYIDDLKADSKNRPYLPPASHKIVISI